MQSYATFKLKVRNSANYIFLQWSLHPDRNKISYAPSIKLGYLIRDMIREFKKRQIIYTYHGLLRLLGVTYCSASCVFLTKDFNARKKEVCHDQRSHTSHTSIPILKC